jgi:hypothetical protein
MGFEEVASQIDDGTDPFMTGQRFSSGAKARMIFGA